MPKVYCAAMDCEFNGDDGKCHAKSIALSANSVMTVWEGRQEFNKRKTYQESQASKDIKAVLEEYEKHIESELRRVDDGNE